MNFPKINVSVCFEMHCMAQNVWHIVYSFVFRLIEYRFFKLVCFCYFKRVSFCCQTLDKCRCI